MIRSNYKSDFLNFLQDLFFRTQLKDNDVVYYYNITSGEQPLSAMCSIVSMTSYLNKICIVPVLL